MILVLCRWAGRCISVFQSIQYFPSTTVLRQIFSFCICCLHVWHSRYTFVYFCCWSRLVALISCVDGWYTAVPANLWIQALSPCSALTTSPAVNYVSTCPAWLTSVSMARRNYHASSSLTVFTTWPLSVKSSTGFSASTTKQGVHMHTHIDTVITGLPNGPVLLFCSL